MDTQIYPDFETFSKLRSQASVVGVRSEFTLDFDTPLSLLSKFGSDELVCLLESLGDKESSSGLSMIGFDPVSTFEWDGNTSIDTWRGHPQETRCSKSPIRHLSDYLLSFQSIYDDDLPLLNGGMIGYISRDITLLDGTNTIESTNSIESTNADPLIHFTVPESFIIFDAQKRKLTILVNTFDRDNHDPETAYQNASSKLAALSDNLTSSPSEHKLLFSSTIPNPTIDDPSKEITNMVAELEAPAKEGGLHNYHVHRIVKRETSADPYSVYRYFRMVYPSEYTYLYRSANRCYIGSHEIAESEPSLSFANIVSHTMESPKFTGVPLRKALRFRKNQKLHYGLHASLFGYVGFNGLYKLTCGFKELSLSNGVAKFAECATGSFTGSYSSPKTLKLQVSGGKSASTGIDQIITSAEKLDDTL